jgi:hypothetical protein
VKIWLAGCLALGGCAVFQSTPAPLPQQVRVDTVTVTRTVEPPLPQGTPAGVCLSTGVTAQIHITASGDTLIGEKRVRISELRPAVSFAGVYAGDREWYRRGDVVTFDTRDYRRAGVARARACDELKLVGEYDGVPIFADVTAPQILPAIMVTVRPGVFQDYLRVR